MLRVIGLHGRRSRQGRQGKSPTTFSSNCTPSQTRNFGSEKTKRIIMVQHAARARGYSLANDVGLCRGFERSCPVLNRAGLYTCTVELQLSQPSVRNRSCYIIAAGLFSQRTAQTLLSSSTFSGAGWGSGGPVWNEYKVMNHYSTSMDPFLVRKTYEVMNHRTCIYVHTPIAVYKRRLVSTCVLVYQLVIENYVTLLLTQ